LDISDYNCLFIICILIIIVNTDLYTFSLHDALPICSHLVYHVEGLKDKVGSFDTELVQEFFQGFVNHAGITLHINLEYGTNSHHMIEAIFKAFARSLDAASMLNPRVKGVPSTKGLL